MFVAETSAVPQTMSPVFAGGLFDILSEFTCCLSSTSLAVRQHVMKSMHWMSLPGDNNYHSQDFSLTRKV